jgi:hypothetical protein
MSSEETIKIVTAISPIVTIIISSIIAPIVLKMITNISNNVIQNENKEKKNINLFDSGFFPGMKRLTKEIYKKDFVSKFKTIIARDLVKIKFDVSYKVVYKWVEENQSKIEGWSNMQLKHELSSLISKIIESYIKEWDDVGLPKIVIDKFQKYHRVNEDIVMSMIDITILNNWETQLQKTFTILDSFIIAFHNAIFDIERVVNPMNGGLKNVTYKGISGANDIDYDDNHEERRKIDKKYTSMFVKLSEETLKNSLSDSQIEAIDKILTDSELEIKI